MPIDPNKPARPYSPAGRLKQLVGGNGRKTVPEGLRTIIVTIQQYDSRESLEQDVTTAMMILRVPVKVEWLTKRRAKVWIDPR